MTDLHDLLTKSLKGFDEQRDRSQQVEIGPSSLGGCRRRVYHDLKLTEKTNLNTESLAAILGTFIHSGIEESIRREDPFGDNFLTEIEVSSGSMKGHIDLFIKDQGIVVDWKTTKVKSLRYFPSEQQRWQVQVYGWLLAQNGYDVKEVSLVAIPRDGEMPDIRVHREQYDEQIANTALVWLDSIREGIAEDKPAPVPEERVAFCSKYCSYYDPTGEIGCPSTAK
jgi:predicted RecB family nuclease